jgi:curved DNA-binding protein CbpA
MKDYYQLLGVEPGADEDAVKSAFRQCVSRHHPDVGGDEAHFLEIMEAYETLSDAARRTEYDILYVEHFPGFSLFDADTGEELEIEYEEAPPPRYRQPEPVEGGATGIAVLLLIVLPALGFGFAMVIDGDPVNAAIVAAISALAAACIGFLIREFS